MTNRHWGRTLLTVFTVAVLGVSACAPEPGGGQPGARRSAAPTATDVNGAGPVLRGVNLFDTVWFAGYRGVSYDSQPQAGYDFLARRGVRLVRLPFLWPQVQPRLRAPLDPQAVRMLRTQLRRAAKAGIKVVLDAHNGCHFPQGNPEPGLRLAACGNGIGTAELDDLWSRLSTAFRTEPALYAYDIMNEPNHISAAVWQRFSQSVVDVLRAAGDRTLLWIEGTGYAAVDTWVRYHPRPWIRDPAHNIVYSAHQYFVDADYPSGYELRAYPGASTRALAHLRTFVDWLQRFRVRGSIGEVGWPNASKARDPGAWNELGERWYRIADAARLPVTYFSASSIGEEIHAAYTARSPGDGCAGGSCTAPPLGRGLGQAAVLERHSTVR